MLFNFFYKTLSNSKERKHNVTRDELSKIIEKLVQKDATKNYNKNLALQLLCFFVLYALILGCASYIENQVLYSILGFALCVPIILLFMNKGFASRCRIDLLDFNSPDIKENINFFVKELTFDFSIEKPQQNVLSYSIKTLFTMTCIAYFWLFWSNKEQYIYIT
jgi:hypothetical protein